MQVLGRTHGKKVLVLVVLNHSQSLVIFQAVLAGVTSVQPMILIVRTRIMNKKQKTKKRSFLQDAGGARRGRDSPTHCFRLVLSLFMRPIWIMHCVHAHILVVTLRGGGRKIKNKGHLPCILTSLICTRRRLCVSHLVWLGSLTPRRHSFLERIGGE